MNAENWIALGAIVVATFTLWSGLLQYRQAQKWKRWEFVANEFKELLSKPVNKNAILMLDYNVRKVELFPDLDDEEQKFVTVTDKMLCEALQVHTTKSVFSKTEVAIRDTFDQFLDDLDRFDPLIESGLVRARDFKPYLIYMIDIMANKRSGRKPEMFVEIMRNYLEAYHYSGVLSLFERYGYPKR